MGVDTLVCNCGMRLKAPGAVPGRVGKCPRCGSFLKVPDASTIVEPPTVVDPTLPTPDIHPAEGTKAEGRGIAHGPLRRAGSATQGRGDSTYR